jgi:CheY-like chemotaxis protein
MKILLVDDSKSARYALRLELQRQGAEVTTADSAEAAFELLKGDLPDAVLMDHTMPGLNGFEALDLIRADPRTAHLPVIICSSNEDPDFATAAAARGAYGILPKSTATDSLPALLGRLQSAHPPSPTPTIAAATAPVPDLSLEPDLRRMIEERVVTLVEDRIEARLSGLLQPLLRDLELGLNERLTAIVRQRIESASLELRDAVEQRLAAESKAAANTLEERLSAAFESGLAPAVATLLPQLLREEIETERAQVLALVDQYVREFTVQESAATSRIDARLSELDGVIAAKAREIIRREVAENMDELLQRNRQTADEVLRQMRGSQTMIHLSILGAALIGILAAAAAYFLPHWR